MKFNFISRDKEQEMGILWPLVDRGTVRGSSLARQGLLCSISAPALCCVYSLTGTTWEPWDAGHWQIRAERGGKDWQMEQEADHIHNTQRGVIIFILSFWEYLTSKPGSRAIKQPSPHLLLVPSRILIYVQLLFLAHTQRKKKKENP